MDTNTLLKENIVKLFARYAIPSIIATVGMSLYIFADTFFIANGIGPIALAALNIVLPIFNVMFGLAAIIGIGGSTLISIYRGKNKHHRLNAVFSMSIVNGLIISVIFFIAGMFFTDDIVRMLGATDKTFQYASSYVRVILILSPLLIMNNILVNFIRNDGKPNLAMIAMTIGTLMNTILDYVLIYIFDLEMVGAALATACSPIVSLCIISTHFIKKENSFKLEKFKYSFYRLKKSIECGAASFVNELSGGIVIFLFNLTILKLGGDMGVAAYGIISNIAIICVYMINGLAQGMQPIISENFGADKRERVKNILYLGIATAMVIGILFFIAGMILPEQITNIFNKEGSKELIDITVRGIRIYFIAFIFVGINIVSIVFYQSTMQSKKSFLLSNLRGWALIILLLPVLAGTLGITGVWFVIPLTEIIIAVTCIVLTIKYIKA